MRNSEYPDKPNASQHSAQNCRWLTVREVAEQFRVSRDTVGRWIRSGLLPAVDVSPNTKLASHRPSWRINSENLEVFMKTRGNTTSLPPRAKPRYKPKDIIEFIK